MKSLIIITAEPLAFSDITSSNQTSNKVSYPSDRRLVVEGDWGWFALYADDYVIGEFEPEELADVLRVMLKPHFAQLEYSSVEAANSALKTLRIPETALIDNDHGLRLSVAEVRQRISQGVDWVTSQA